MIWTFFTILTLCCDTTKHKRQSYKTKYRQLQREYRNLSKELQQLSKRLDKLEERQKGETGGGGRGWAVFLFEIVGITDAVSRSHLTGTRRMPASGGMSRAASEYTRISLSKDVG